MQVSVLQSYGGRIADDAGTKARSSRKRPALPALGQGRLGQKVFPPGNTTWDGAGDNQAYLSGQAAFIANTGSVGIAASPGSGALRGDRLFLASRRSEGVVSPIRPNVRAVSKTSKNPDAAKALIEHLAKPDFVKAYFNVAIYGPVLKNQANSPPSARTRSWPACSISSRTAQRRAPRTSTTRHTPILEQLHRPKMVQRVVIDGWDFDRAMDEAQTQGQAIYDKYK